MSLKLPFIAFCSLLCLNAHSQVISSSRSVNWSLAGVEPDIAWSGEMRMIADFGGDGNGNVSNNAPLQAAMNSLNGAPGIIYFPAGNYFFNSSIALPNGVVLKGENATTTTLRFNLGGAASNCININGSRSGAYYPLTAEGLTKGSDSVWLTNTANFAEGDFVQIQQDNGNYLFSDWASGSVSQINKIKAVEGNKITLQYALRRSFDAGMNPRIQKLNMKQQAGLECLKIIREDATANQTSHISFNLAANCKVQDCWLENSNFAFASIAYSTSITLEGNYFYNAFSWGDGGKAYGVSVEFASGQVLIQNNIFRLLRHSVLFQSGANGNVAGYNYSLESRKTVIINLPSEDIACHGNYPYANLIEGNIVGSIKVDASHGINGRFNTIFRNRTTNALGISVTENQSDGQNVVGNQITGNGAYSFVANNHFLHGNNRNGTLTPAGTGTLDDYSYYLADKPAFWNIDDTWYGIGYPSTATNTRIPALSRYTAFISSGSSPVAGCQSVPLPLRLVYFNGTGQLGGHIYLQWKIENTAPLQVALQRSWDGVEFSTISNQPSLAGGSFTHTDGTAGLQPAGRKKIFYRLLLTANDGTSQYSPVLMIEPQTGEAKFRVWPSPATQWVHIAATDPNLAGSNGKITDITGKTVRRFIVAAGQTTLSVGNLPAGMYLVQFANGEVAKFIK